MSNLFVESVSFMKDVIEIVTLLVLSLTLVEIARTRRATVQQKDLQILPAPMLYLEGEEDNRRLYIKNLGLGTAAAVTVEPSSFMSGRKKLEFKFKLAGSNSTLESGEKREVNVSLFKDGEADRNHHRYVRDFVSYHGPEDLHALQTAYEAGQIKDLQPPFERKISVRFKDAAGQGYKTVILFSAADISVEQAPRRTWHLAK